MMIAMALLMSAVAVAQGNSQGHGHGRGNSGGNNGGNSDENGASSSGGKYVFSANDRSQIIDCMNGGGREGLPPGLAKRDRLPPGLERQLQRNGHLPPGLEKKMQPMPRSCEVRLPRLPSNITRVVVGNYVILKDIHDRILDLIDYNRRR